MAGRDGLAMRMTLWMTLHEQIQQIEDPRVPGAVVHRLDEILLTVRVGLLCRAEDFDGTSQITFADAEARCAYSV
jgi:hypothetical protein